MTDFIGTQNRFGGVNFGGLSMKEIRKFGVGQIIINH